MRVDWSKDGRNCGPGWHAYDKYCSEIDLKVVERATGVQYTRTLDDVTMEERNKASAALRAKGNTPPANPAAERFEVLMEFYRMLEVVTGDGSKKRQAAEKPSWKVDKSHEPAIFSHLNKWKHGELKDPDSGAHPLVHLAWRALAIAWQETNSCQCGKDKSIPAGAHRVSTCAIARPLCSACLNHGVQRTHGHLGGCAVYDRT